MQRRCSLKIYKLHLSEPGPYYGQTALPAKPSEPNPPRRFFTKAKLFHREGLRLLHADAFVNAALYPRPHDSVSQGWGALLVASPLKTEGTFGPCQCVTIIGTIVDLTQKHLRKRLAAGIGLEQYGEHGRQHGVQRVF